ncbi:MAG: hypothetical protein COW85_09105 [Ignavibacteria bacterium CG22_combo_CG10-13_8_21_14_all_37_15]|nr:DUF3109 family protein [Ignavibacteria bacterium]OIO13667.1 MAG: hypothetical protein AUJ54_15840 [Ignavibacteria bacterium CG1_02_37_35]PIP77408.1 MAG: hypothetical protein COW85_09105 [Ignavibacteria bacterium CG22_combo_CG10-13_8_21_14_all_37_15]PIX92923.1 MAG: DUF3109 domain-containing protein [Ignavibacteria bacterium CG_4_10_14_3_um_filter_37_18]PJC57268.1 MAG: DUF3109 domain-containing protein [Ignavibacteria bacterium CG_4_9_14_0_2_um_filter_37_13]
MFNSNFISINNVLLRKEVIETPFSCDLSKCKGACCTLESEYGAPLNEEEIVEMEKVLPLVENIIPQKHWEEIEEVGFYEEKDGELLTRSVNNKACVFVYYEDKIAKCSLEKLFFEKKSSFQKPISCHLFPIRVSDFGGEILRFEKFSDCSSALEKGANENVTAFQFCQNSLERKYSNKWYKKAKELTGK